MNCLILQLVDVLLQVEANDNNQHLKETCDKDRATMVISTPWPSTPMHRTSKMDIIYTINTLSVGSPIFQTRAGVGRHSRRQTWRMQSGFPIRYTTPILTDGVFLRSLIGASAEFIVRSHNSRVSISTTVAQVTLPKRYPGPFLGQLRHPPRVGRKSTTPKSPFLEGNLLNLIASSNVTSLVKKNSHHRKGSRLMGFLFACSECLLCLDCWRHDPV